MKSALVWALGLIVMACAAKTLLPGHLQSIESHLQARVDKRLERTDLRSVKATVDGQKVSLRLTSPVADGAERLNRAQAAVLGLKGPELVSPFDRLGLPPITQVTVLQFPPAVITSASVTAEAFVTVEPEALSLKSGTLKSGALKSGTLAITKSASEAAYENLMQGLNAADVTQCNQTVQSRLQSQSFDTLNKDLSPASEVLLDQVYDALKACKPGLNLTLIGYAEAADATQAVARGLVRRGFAADHVRIETLKGPDNSGGVALQISAELDPQQTQALR
jgi:hypothetical protein